MAAHRLAQLFLGHAGVFQHIVQHRSGQYVLILGHGADNFRRFHHVQKIGRPAAFAVGPVMGLGRQSCRLAQQAAQILHFHASFAL